MTEQIGIDNLLGIVDDAFKRGGKAVLKNIGKQMAAEGAEEFLAAVAEPIYDDMVMGEKSQFNIRVKELEQSGMTHKDARRQTMLEKGSEIIMSAASGAISGGIMGGGGTAVGAVGYYAGNKEKKRAEKSAETIPQIPRNDTQVVPYNTKETGADATAGADVADKNDGNIEAVGVDGTLPQNETEDPSHTSPIKRGTDIVVNKLSEGEWSQEHENTYNNAVRDLEATKAQTEDESARREVQNEIDRIQKIRALKTAKTADDVLRAYIPTAEIMTADEAVSIAEAELRAINAEEPKDGGIFKEVTNSALQDWKEKSKLSKSLQIYV